MQNSTTPTTTTPARKAKRIIVGVIAGGVITSGLAFGAVSANAAQPPPGPRPRRPRQPPHQPRATGTGST